MQQNVTTGLGGDLCGLLAQQTDEGNLSCGSCSAEQGQPRPLLLASSVTCHAAVGAREGETRRVDGRGERGWTRGEERPVWPMLSVASQAFAVWADLDDRALKMDVMKHLAKGC